MCQSASGRTSCGRQWLFHSLDGSLHELAYAATVCLLDATEASRQVDAQLCARVTAVRAALSEAGDWVS